MLEFVDGTRWMRRGGRWRARLFVIVGAALLAACATPGTPPAAPTKATVAFDDASWRALMTKLAAEGWVHIVTGVGAPDRTRPDVTVETRFLLNPNAIVRHGDVVRVHAMTVPAQAAGEVRATRVVVDYHCAARTWQVRTVETYRNAEATDRITGGPANAAPVTPIAKGSPGERMFHAVCAGAFAETGVRVGAPLPQQPTIAGRPAAAARATQASGVFVAPRRVLTNAHAVTQCASVDVTLDGRRHSARVLKRDAANDLALLDVASLDGSAFPALRASAALGEAVVAAGFPPTGTLGSGMTVTNGLVSSLSGAGDNSAHLQMSAAVQPGNSGGPLIDAGGNLVGLVVARLDELTGLALAGAPARDVGYAIKPEIVGIFLRGENVSLRSADRAGAIGTSEVAARAKAFTARVNCAP